MAASHAGEWCKHGEESSHNSTTSKSRTGYALLYARYPIVWASRLQTEIALSSTVAEYITISTMRREVIPLLRLMEEVKSSGLPISMKWGKIHCHIFEDNSGTLEMAKMRILPNTKHISVKYHQFINQVLAGLLSLPAVPSAEQIADIFTKLLPDGPFLKHRKAIMGW